MKNRKLEVLEKFAGKSTKMKHLQNSCSQQKIKSVSLLTCSIILAGTLLCQPVHYKAVNIVSQQYLKEYVQKEVVSIQPVKVKLVTKAKEVKKKKKKEFEWSEEYTYLARCVEAEAGNQSYKGKCYVADVILNRVKDSKFSNNIIGVINGKNSFECVSNGSIWSVSISDETREVVKEQLKNQLDYEILYFRTGHYHNFGTPCFQYEDHYFSK